MTDLMLHAMSPDGDVLIFSDADGVTLASGGMMERVNPADLDRHIRSGNLLRVHHEPFADFGAMVDYVNERVRDA